MKAIVQDRFGSSDVLEFRSIDTPVAGDGEVLVQVLAASVNAYDWHMMRGDPYLARLMLRSFRGPTSAVRGRDFAGRVAAVGTNVTEFSAGDEVYGDAGHLNGTFAEYVCVPLDQVTHKPANLSFEEAAAVPLAADTALTGLCDVAEVQSGQRVLINGASGGVGTFAVQLAAACGADVTAVCSTRNVELVRGLGADRVIDYTEQDFTRDGRQYDVVFDLVGNHSVRGLRRALTPSGTLLLSGGGTSKGGSLVGPMGLIIRAQLVSRFVSHRMAILTETPSRRNLVRLRELIESGRLIPVIDRTYPLPETPAAIRYVEIEHARAKVIITM
jgi:NADPH:quinone reductase-like Zn-dependent oxidoreductase